MRKKQKQKNRNLRLHIFGKKKLQNYFAFGDLLYIYIKRFFSLKKRTNDFCKKNYFGFGDLFLKYVGDMSVELWLSLELVRVYHHWSKLDFESQNASI